MKLRFEEEESMLTLCKSRRRTVTVVAAALLLGSMAAQAQQLLLSNPLPVERREVVAIALDQLRTEAHFSAEQIASQVAVNSASGERVPTQLYATQAGAAPDQMLLLVSFHPSATVSLAFHPEPGATPARAEVFGRPVPERKDDFAWENEVVAYRVYGPALEATGEISSGIDVWSKRIPNFVVDNFYALSVKGEQTHDPAFSYHRDNGQGLDSYDVGPTRGCGGTAIWSDGKLVVSKNYTSARILAAGPIRFEFEMQYAPWQAGGRTVTESKRIALDAGSHLNRIVSTLRFDGDAPLTEPDAPPLPSCSVPPPIIVPPV